MSINNVNRFLNIEDSHLRVVSGNVYAQALNVGGITVGSASGLQSVTNVSNTTNDTIELTNATTSLKASSNIELTSTSKIVVESNVVTEFPRSKKLIKYPRVALTSGQSGLGNGYTQDGYTVKVSNESSPTLASYAFNGKYGDNDVTGAYWYTGNLNTYNGTPTGGYYVGSVNLGSDGGRTATVSGDWIELELPNKIKLEYFKYFSQNDGVNGAQDGVLYARNTTNEDWTLVHSYTDALVPDQNTAYTFNVNSTNHYKIYALVLTRKTPANTGTGGVSVGELEFYGLPEYDPDAAGMDVKVTSYPNVPNTDWLEVYYDAKESSSYPGTGGTVLDLSGNSRNGVLGGVTFDNGEIKAFDFSGAYTSNVTTSDHGLGTGDVTYSMAYWFKRTAKSNGALNDYIIMMGNGGTARSSILMHIINDELHLDHWSASIKYQEQIILNKWYHVVAGHKGGVTPNVQNDFIYIDGKLSSIFGGGTVGNFTLAGSKLTLGSEHNGTTEYFNGKIANFRLFSRALTSDEVWQLYAYQKEYFGHGDLGMTLKNGRLGIGTSVPRAALDVRGDLFGPGIVQVQSTTFDGITSGNSNSFTTLPGLTTRITPKKSGSKILVLLNLFWSGITDSYFQGNVKKNGTVLVKQEGSVGSASKTSFAMLNYDRPQYFLGNIGFSHLDDTVIGTPQLEYTVEVRNRYTGNASWYINYTSDTADANRLTAVSTLTLIEIQQ